MSAPASRGRPAAGKFIVRDGARSVAVEVRTDGTVMVEGADAAFSVTPAGHGRYLVTDGSRSCPVFVTGPADARHVFADGRAALVDIDTATAKRSKKSRAGGGDGTVAPMPGTVITIMVSVGQHVAVGDVLLTLEAMKMELPLRSPRDGVVKAVLCRPGELVQPGSTLVDLA